MKPSEKCKQAGLDSLAELAKITGESVQTLNNWHKNKPQLFAVVLTGAVEIKKGGTKKMKIFARDILTGKVIHLTATLTTDHPCSSYGQPVMLIDEWEDQQNNVMSYDNWMLAGCGVIDYGTEEQQALFDRWISTLVAMMSDQGKL